MAQELGESVQEMMKADDQAVQDILNSRPTGHYYIVIHHKETKARLNTGEAVLMRHIKAYDKRPMAQVGIVILEVKDGDIIDTVVCPHDAPIAWDEVEKHAGLITDPSVQESPISQSYLYTD